MKNKNQKNSINDQTNRDDTDLVKSESKGDQLLSKLLKRRFPIINDPTPTNPEINHTTIKNSSDQHFMQAETADEKFQPEKAAFEAYENAIKLLPKD